MENEFLNNTSLISYSNKSYEKTGFSSISEIVFKEDKQVTKWLNTYGNQFNEIYNKVIHQNKLDDFLIKLLSDDEHPNKVILLNDFEILSVIRNMKIIGIFARLAERDKKKMYLKLIPHAWKLIELRMQNNQIFNGLKRVLNINFPKKIRNHK